jgi:hypothetical protein
MNPPFESDVAISQRRRTNDVPARNSHPGRVSANGSNWRARTSS